VSAPRENVWFVPNRNVRLTKSGWDVNEPGVLMMSQRERDRLVVLRKAEKKLITQRQAATELDASEWQIH
jgi:hypothetical protein